MITRKSVLLAAAFGIAAIVNGGSAKGQSSQAPGQPAPPMQTSPAPLTPAAPTREAASWQPVIGPERSFTAEMPAAPSYSTRDVRTAAGSSYTLHQYLLEQDDVAYVVHTAIYPSDVTVKNPRTNLQGGLDAAAKTIDGGKWASVDWKTRERLTAVDAVGARGSHAVRTFSVLKGRQIFTLTYIGPPGSVRSPDVERFLGSLNIGP